MRAVRIWRSAGRGRHRGRCDGSRGRQLRIAAAARFRLEGEVERRRRCQLRRHPGSWRLGTTHDTQTVGNNVMKNSGPFHFRAGARRERERAVGLSTSNEGIQHPAAANSIFICLCVCVSLLLMAGPVPELLVVYPQTAGLVAGAGGSAPVRHRRILPIGFGSCTSIHPLFYYRSCCRRRHNSSHRPLLFAGGFPISKIQHKAKGNGEKIEKKRRKLLLSAYQRLLPLYAAQHLPLWFCVLILLVAFFFLICRLIDPSGRAIFFVFFLSPIQIAISNKPINL